MVYGVVIEELVCQVLAELPDDEARDEVRELLERAQQSPYSYPDVRDPGSTEEIREAWAGFCWLQYRPMDRAIEVREIGWLG